MVYSGFKIDWIREGKELLADELSDNKEKILKIVAEKKEWEKEKYLLVENVNVLKEKQTILEKKDWRSKKRRWGTSNSTYCTKKYRIYCASYDPGKF